VPERAGKYISEEMRLGVSVGKANKIQAGRPTNVASIAIRGK